MIVLDTSVLLEAFGMRRGSGGAATSALGELTQHREILAIPGIVLQEVEAGLRTDLERARMELALAGYPTLIASRSDHLVAGRLISRLRSKGHVIGGVDALIAAQTIQANASLFSLDEDFVRIAANSSLRLHALP